jgi:hypothetical protein
MNEKYGILKNKKGIEKTNLLDDLELVVASKQELLQVTRTQKHHKLL